jgi:copper resistance protein C
MVPGGACRNAGQARLHHPVYTSSRRAAVSHPHRLIFMSGRFSRYFFAVALSTGMLVSFGASAHVTLVGSVPQEGTVVRAGQAPRQLELRFGHALRLTSVRLVREGGDKVALKPGAKASTTHAVDLPALVPGDYTAEWRGMASDGHVMSGAVRFKVAAP